MRHRCRAGNAATDGRGFMKWEFAMKAVAILLGLTVAVWAAAAAPGWAQGAPEVPRIDSVVMAAPQPQAADKAVIWYDDFDGPPKQYTESQGKLDAAEGFGGRGQSVLCFYEKGSKGVGNRKVFFGDSPVGKVVNKGQRYDDIYWRIYVKHQYGWQGGGPAKLSRATSIVSGKWAQAMIAHVWSSGEALTLDPASGVRGDQISTTKYNDFPNLHWLGNKPASQFKLSSAAEAGRWVCVEARARLNNPGKKDGLNQLWIDGRLEAERKNLDWRGSYTQHGINAIFLEAYWNQGSPVDQSRWIDNFVISTKPIGPVVCSPNPVLLKTPYHGPGKQQVWEAEIAADPDGNTRVWKSRPLAAPERVVVGADSGEFLGPLAGKTQLDPGHVYYLRVRQQSDAGAWSPWSPWHQPFCVAREAGGQQ
jgi:hypothetical protein